VKAAIDVGALVDRGPWTLYQKSLTALAALAVIFDGFDIQILGFAIPSLMREWHVTRAAFAPVLALGLAGMAAGSPFAGYCGDRYGRRPALIGCVTLFGLATVATAFVHSVTALAVLIGFGLGFLATVMLIVGLATMPFFCSVVSTCTMNAARSSRV
jgi:AAHS family 4-hydroxybenzoate transporter-like MFS transporter